MYETSVGNGYEIFWSILTAVLLLALAGKLAKKAGYSWAWCFSMLVPLVNIFVIFLFAFSKWPIEKELMYYRMVDFQSWLDEQRKKEEEPQKLE